MAIYGPELLTNTTFKNAGDGWTESGGTEWTFDTSPNRATHPSTLTAIISTTASVSIDVTKQYNLRVHWVGTGYADFAVGERFIEEHTAADGNINVVITPNSTGTTVFSISPVAPGGGTRFVGYITFVSLREIISGASEGTLPDYNPSLSSALCVVQQNLSFPRFVFGGQGGAAENEYELFKLDTTGENYGVHIIRWKFTVGCDFDVVAIKFKVFPEVSGNREILPVLRFDNNTSSSAGTTINTASYPNDEQLIELTAKNFNNAVHGKHDFIFELQIKGTDLAVIELPIEIEIDKQNT